MSTNTEIVPIDEVPVPADAARSGYRITIPKSIRDEFGLNPGTFVTIRLVTDGKRPARFSDTVDTNGRVGIPPRLRDGFGVEPGGTVDIELVDP